MGTRETRERKQNWFIFKFREAKPKGRMLDVKKLVSSFCLEMYSTQREAHELLKIFEGVGKIRINKGQVEVIR